MAGREVFGTEVIDKDAARRPGPGEYPYDDTYNMPTPPSYTFQKRYKPPKDLDRRPGPNEYKLPSTLTDKTYTIGSGERPPLWQSSTGMLGPGEYPIPGSCGKQVESKMETLPLYSIPQAGQTKSKIPKGGPIYELKYQSAIGKQLMSKYKNAPQISLSGRTAFGSIYGW